MTYRLQFQIEASGETATLYISRRLSTFDVERLCDECASLPDSIRTLRMDLTALAAVGPDATDAVRAVLERWRMSRRGQIRLSFSSPELSATLTSVDRVSAVRPSSWSGEPLNEALTATYL